MKASTVRSEESSPTAQGNAQDASPLSATGFSFIDQEFDRVPFGEAIRASQGVPAEDLASALDQAVKDSPVLNAFSPSDSKPIGQGEEAICFDLPPVQQLLKDTVFADALQQRLQDSTQLRAALLRDIPDDVPAYATLEDSVAKQVVCIMNNLPQNLVVKIVRPDGGSWDSTWGNREFDAPIYFSHQLDEIDHYIIVQEKMNISANTAEAKSILPKGFELYDAIGRQQDEGENASGTGQFGHNQYGRLLLVDYGAVGPTGGAGSIALMTSYHTGEDFDEYDERSAQDESANGLYEFSEVESANMQKQMEALSGEGEFWVQYSHRTILQGLIEEAQGACKLPEADAIEQIVLLRALELSGSEDFHQYQETARSEVQAVIARAIAEKILLRSSD